MEYPSKRSGILSPRTRSKKSMSTLLSPRSVSLRQLRRRSSSEEFGSKSVRQKPTEPGPRALANIMTMSRIPEQNFSEWLPERNAPGPLHTRPASPRDREWKQIAKILEDSEFDEEDLLEHLLVGPLPDSPVGEPTQFKLEIGLPRRANRLSSNGSQESGSSVPEGSETTSEDSSVPFPGIPLYTLSDKVRVRKVTKEWARLPALPQSIPESSHPTLSETVAPEEEEEMDRPKSKRKNQVSQDAKTRSDTVTKLLAGIVSAAHDDLRAELERVRKDSRDDLERAREQHKEDRDRAQAEIDQLRQDLEEERDIRDDVDSSVHRLELEIQKLQLQQAGVEAELSVAIKEKELSVLEFAMLKKSTEGMEDHRDLVKAHEENFREISQENAVLASENKLILARLVNCTCEGIQ